MDTTSTGSPASVHDWPWMNTSLSPDERAALLLAQLTLEEKVGMVHGKSNDAYYMEPVSRLGIPALTMTDGPSGINEGQATALPAPIGLAATGDLAAAEQYGELVGREAEATGHNVFLGACLDIARVPVYGRMFEALGEDPILTGQMTVRSIQSVQRRHIVATAKHYNVNTQEENRLQVDAQLDERTLQEIYTLPFAIAAQDGQVGAAMGAYNKVNGVHSCEHPVQISPLPVEEHGKQAREIAGKGIVLLKNAGGLLPLSSQELRSLAVIGGDADHNIAGGGSSLVKPTYLVSMLEGIRRRVGEGVREGVRVEYAEGVDPASAVDLLPGPPLVPSSVLMPAGSGPQVHGLRAEYWTNTRFEGEPRLVRTDRQVALNLGFFNYSIFNASSLRTPEEFNNAISVRWTGSLTAPVTGEYTLALTHLGTARLFLDGRLLIDEPGVTLSTQSVTLQLVAGQPYT